ncbi:hypothetical protein KAZ01_02740, partial [Candidatus Gracilibacteria bacterium]|nr:hypothetical protein [Candidatus Gracilibacteria bacterium]
MLNNIIFLSNKNEIDLLGDYYNKDSIIFSLHNSISIELDKRNIDYVYPENYIDLEKFLKITLSNYEIVNNICTKIDQYVQKIIYLNHFNLCKRMFFHFELLINTIIAYYLMIESVVKKNPSKNIIYLENDENLYNIDTLFYDDVTRYFQKII